MKNAIKLSVLYLALALLTVSGWGQAAPTKRSAPKAKVALQLDGPFDATVELLPPGFVGHSVAAVYAAIVNNRPPEKDQFQTAEQHREKIESWRQGLLAGTLMRDSLLAIAITKCDYFGAMNCSYHAETSQWTITIQPSIMTVIIRPGLSLGAYRAFFLSSDVTELGSYVGSNAFNRKVSVRRFRNMQFNLAAVARRAMKYEMHVPMEAGKAKQADGAIGLLWVARLKDPYAHVQEDRTTPTIDSPNDGTIIRHFIFIEPLEFWLYNTQTGEIYHRNKADEILGLPPS